LIEAAAEAGRKAKDAQKALDEKVAAKYEKLIGSEIKSIVIDDKWLATIASNIDMQAQAIATQFAARIKELIERYASPLPHLSIEIETLMDKVNAHLKKMGFA
jgi:type I restriction enzyme M protein